MARTGRYKWLLTGSLLVLALGLWMMTNLHANTDQPVIWLWMAVTGLGIGPTFAVFTLIVQNAVRARQVGSATASVGFFQMIGGTVGLTIAGTWFATSLLSEIPRQLLAVGVPQQFVDAFQGSGSEPRPHRRGRSRCAPSSRPPPRSSSPSSRRSSRTSSPGSTRRCRSAIASTFWIGIVGALIAAVSTLFLVEVPMRQTMEIEDDEPVPMPDAERRAAGMPGSA